MTNILLRRVLLSTIVGALVLVTTALLPAAQAQNPPAPPAPRPFATPLTPSAADIANFPPQLLEELSAIKTAALADDYAYRQVAHLTENIGPRPSGSPQAKAAVEYVADQLRQLGLDVHLEPVKVPHWIRGAEAAELVEYPGQPAGTSQKVVLTALGAFFLYQL